MRIVPSTGRSTAWYAASAARRSAIGQVCGPDLGQARERVGEAAQDLRCDHSGVAAGTHEGTVRDCPADLLHALGGRELRGDRLEREGHVRPGVAVGHRVHVEAVQLLLVHAEGVAVAQHRSAQVGGP